METKLKNIHIERLKDRFQQMASIGRTESGGVTRLALSPEDREARELLVHWMQKIGLATRYDDVGNIYGRLEGREKNADAVLIGSHIDTVPNGGQFDGTLGVLAALEVVQSIKEQQKELKHPVEIVSFTNEEGARFTPQMLGSGVVANEFTREYVYERKDMKGLSFYDQLKKIGFVGSEANRLKNGKAFLEFHIEQGPVLEAENLPVGVVEGIAGFAWMEVIINGQSNHSGTTPMHLRQDPLVAAAAIIKELHDFAKNKKDGTVITTGRIQAFPNIINAIPSQTIFSIDVRHAERKSLESTIAEIKKIVEQHAGEVKMDMTTEEIWTKHPVSFSPKVISVIEQICKQQQTPFKRMISGAGHDAMYMNAITDTAMIFVPSVAGKSHCKEEETSWDDIEKGMNILYDTVCKLANGDSESL
ncbi:Zn-dependent hydrolase [Sporosarcina sp. HYO08]|uniref:Zn-dependent hydrolase n=1 Tax=Sporosarcina sp. HYO08 TaxID=1759557 RepID=UPI00079BE913|nr:Zn-dependent hydrolase [Sporosarcina sp. HYO08]KXH87025.1 hypothetical protein AU377_00125 [Sporosarcina sp. HYO08]